MSRWCQQDGSCSAPDSHPPHQPWARRRKRKRPYAKPSLSHIPNGGHLVFGRGANRRPQGNLNRARGRHQQCQRKSMALCSLPVDLWNSNEVRMRIISAKPAMSHRIRHSKLTSMSSSPLWPRPEPLPAIPVVVIQGSGSSTAMADTKKAIAITGRPARSNQAVSFASLRPKRRKEACSNQTMPTQRGRR